MNRTDQRDAVRTWVVVWAIGLSWWGLLIHNLADLGPGVLLGPETLVPTAVCVLLAAGLATPARPAARVLLVGWVWLNLIGGGLLSVVPLPIWPYSPEQSLHHYAFHALYAATQLPLLIVLAEWRGVRVSVRQRP